MKNSHQQIYWENSGSSERHTDYSCINKGWRCVPCAWTSLIANIIRKDLSADSSMGWTKQESPAEGTISLPHYTLLVHKPIWYNWKVMILFFDRFHDTFHTFLRFYCSYLRPFKSWKEHNRMFGWKEVEPFHNKWFLWLSIYTCMIKSWNVM